MISSRRSILPQLAWHALAIIALACVPSLKFHAPWWALKKHEQEAAILLLCTYAASALAVMLFVRTEGRRAAGLALLITLAVFGLALPVVVALVDDVPRYLLLPVFAAAVVLIPLSELGTPMLRLGVVALALSAIGAGVLSYRQITHPRQAAYRTTESVVNSAFYALRVVNRDGAIPMPATRGGGLDHLDDRVLLGTGDGTLYLVTPGTDDALKIEELPTRVPANREEFAAAFGGSSRAPSRSIDCPECGPPRIQTWRFRVTDVVARTSPAEVRIYAAHHYWKAREQCFVMRVSELTAPHAGFPQSAKDARWHTLYESRPCVPVTGKLRKRGKNPFRGEESGGRLALLDDHTLLLTIGDHAFYGGESLQAFAQDPQASYGKTIRIDLDAGTSRIYTLGHRNPQGLYAAKDGRIWLTEHGPQGGDELNLLVEGSNYGWPIVTYGTDYGTFGWRWNPRQGHHDGYTQPQYAFVPSIGVSNLIMIERDLLGIWKGNLVVGSLATRSLYRLTLEGNHVVVNEPIQIGRRVRDLLEMDDGRLLVWTDDGALVTLEPTRGMSGAGQFGTLCSGCHQIVDGVAHRIGPDLYGVLGRKIAGAAGFDDYSPALQQLGGVWNRERLDAFLRDPQAAAPGTSMAFPGLPDDKLRAALIDHLEAAGRQPPMQ
jgi:glucose/arabinose dehydrogenase/cytochrome c2